MFSDNFVNLCAENNEYPTNVAVKLGFSRAAGAKWANGSVPHKPTLAIIANYFGITVDELLEDKKNPATIESDGISPIKQKAIQRIKEASETEARMLMDILEAWQKNKNPADQGGADD